MHDTFSTPQTERAARNRKASGFTLIELLVVIAIIAILAAILFPVFARARENARRSSCQNNVKNIGLGFRQYTQDYDEKYPPLYADNGAAGYTATSAAGTPTGDQGWVQILQPYIKSTQVFQCPSETRAGDNTANVTDYWYNVSLTNGAASTTAAFKGDKGGVSEAALDFVASTVMIGDGEGSSAAYGFNGIDTHDDGGDFAALPAPPATGGRAVTGGTVGATPPVKQFGLRHLDGLNYGFADGHVKWLKSGSQVSLNKVYNASVPFTAASGVQSGQDPTFNATK